MSKLREQSKAAQYLLWIGTSRVFPILFSFLLFLFFYFLEAWLLSFLALATACLVFYFIAREEAMRMTSWDSGKSITLLAFSLLFGLASLALVSIITVKLEWTVIALTLSVPALILLLFAYYFKPYR